MNLLNITIKVVPQRKVVIQFSHTEGLIICDIFVIYND